MGSAVGSGTLQLSPSSVDRLAWMRSAQRLRNSACRRPSPRSTTFMCTQPVLPGTATSRQVAPSSVEIITELVSWSPDQACPGTPRAAEDGQQPPARAGHEDGLAHEDAAPLVRGEDGLGVAPGDAVVQRHPAPHLGGVLVPGALRGVEQPERPGRGAEQHRVLLRTGVVVAEPDGRRPDVGAVRQAGEPDRDVADALLRPAEPHAGRGRRHRDGAASRRGSAPSARRGTRPTGRAARPVAAVRRTARGRRS